MRHLSPISRWNWLKGTQGNVTVNNAPMLVSPERNGLSIGRPLWETILSLIGEPDQASAFKLKEEDVVSCLRNLQCYVLTIRRQSKILVNPSLSVSESVRRSNDLEAPRLRVAVTI